MFQVRQPFESRLHVGHYRPYPTLQADRGQHAQTGQLQVGRYIVGLVLGGGEAKLRLKNPQLIQVHVEQGFFQLGKPQLGRLHAVPVGNIDKINLGQMNLFAGSSGWNQPPILSRFG